MDNKKVKLKQKNHYTALTRNYNSVLYIADSISRNLLSKARKSY